MSPVTGELEPVNRRPRQRDFGNRLDFPLEGNTLRS
jgi:hypothetical protein